MSTVDLTLPISYHERDAKETTASTKKQNPWSTRCVLNNDCVKKIIECCNVHEIFRFACVNRHCNYIVSTTYSNLSFCVRTLHSNFTNRITFTIPTEMRTEEEDLAWWDNLRRDVVIRNGKLTSLKYDVSTTIGEDEDVVIKRDKKTIKVEDRRNGECLLELIPSNIAVTKIISVFKISKKHYITASSDGKIDRYHATSRSSGLVRFNVVSFVYNSSNISVSKAIKIEQKIYLLSKRTIEDNLILMCYDLNNKKPSIFCKGSTYGNDHSFTPIIDCIANKTHIFVIFEYGVACYDNQNNLIWQQNDITNTTNENAVLELSDKFLLITSWKTNGSGNIEKLFYKVYNIANGTRKDLKIKKADFIGRFPDEIFKFWGDYVISQTIKQDITKSIKFPWYSEDFLKVISTSADIELWNPNNGQLILHMNKPFTYYGNLLWPLKNNEGLIGLSICKYEKEKQNLFQRLFSSNTPKDLTKYEFFLLKADTILPNKNHEKR